jgi:SAM-dependent methyltransferase
MVVSSSREPHLRRPEHPGAARAVIWHDVECGAYRADLPFWRGLADAARADGGGAPILDIGAGSGRVALDLSAAGHAVTALDLERDLLLALRERAAADGRIETVCADARTFQLSRRDFALCIAPMQTVQLFSGSGERVAFLRRVRAHMRPGGLLACAIVTHLEPFDCASGDAGPSAELARVGGDLYLSRAVSVRVGIRRIVIERERRVLAAGGRGAELACERDVVELARVSPSQLAREGIKAGLTPAPAGFVGATEDHVGSVVVMLRA